MKSIKRVAIIILGIVGLNLGMVGISYINHQIQLSKEEELVRPMGQLVEVNGNLIHIYSEGEGTETLVFMSGGGTCSPVLDFRTLYKQLSDEYRIVVVEKNGYGFSEISNSPREIDIVLDETRTVLQQVGITGPYILVPHSMSGIEALYWAQKYPQEVNAIIGLDPAVPKAYENLEINMSVLKLGALGAKIGITRWIPSIVESSAAIKDGMLTEEEKKMYKAIFYRRTATKPMLEEVEEIKTSARKVEQGKVPQIPMLFFVSNGEGTGWDSELWRKNIVEYIEQNNQASYIQLEVGHYIHNIAYERIEKEIEKFIAGIENGVYGF